MKRRRTIYLYLLAVAIVGIAAISFSIWNMPHQNISEAAAIEISAMALYDSLANKNPGFKSTLINHVVTVTGSVKQVMNNQQGQQVILLNTNVADAAINCTMEEEIKKVKDGEMLTLKGVCMGYSGGDAFLDLPGDVIITRCVLNQTSDK